MSNSHPQFIIEHDGKYYLTQNLWLYDASQGTDEQKAGAQTVAQMHANAAVKTTAALVPQAQAHSNLGTAITAMGTAITAQGTAITAQGTAITGDGGSGGGSKA